MTILTDPLWAELLSVGNIVFYTFLGYYAFRLARMYRGWRRFLMLMMAFVGFYWVGIYVFVLLTPSGTYDAVLFGRVFIRPAFTFMGAVMASVTIYRWRLEN